MSLPPPGPATGWRRQSAFSTRTARHRGPAVRGAGLSRRRTPGWLAVTVGTLLVITTAMVEVDRRGAIGVWTGVVLCLASVVAAVLTRPGDRSLPVMMPPLAFATAVLIAGQSLVKQTVEDPWQRQAVMIVETLGRNAAWVVGATLLAFVIALIGHLIDKRNRQQPAPPR